jgi:hypothetical protein
VLHSNLLQVSLILEGLRSFALTLTCKTLLTYFSFSVLCPRIDKHLSISLNHFCYKLICYKNKSLERSLKQQLIWTKLCVAARKQARVDFPIVNTSIWIDSHVLNMLPWHLFYFSHSQTWSVQLGHPHLVSGMGFGGFWRAQVKLVWTDHSVARRVCSTK